MAGVNWGGIANSGNFGIFCVIAQKTMVLVKNSSPFWLKLKRIWHSVDALYEDDARYYHAAIVWSAIKQDDIGASISLPALESI